jgi:hypothetical protein
MKVLFYKLGESGNAKADFSEFLLLIGDQEINIPETIKQELRELPSTYNNIKNLRSNTRVRTQLFLKLEDSGL